MKLKVGRTYRTHGGWTARVLWKRAGGGGFYVIHHPGDRDKETAIVFHKGNGRSVSAFSISDESPTCSQVHPGDLIEDLSDEKRSLEQKKVAPSEKPSKEA